MIELLSVLFSYIGQFYILKYCAHYLSACLFRLRKFFLFWTSSLQPRLTYILLSVGGWGLLHYCSWCSIVSHLSHASTHKYVCFLINLQSNIFMLFPWCECIDFDWCFLYIFRHASFLPSTEEIFSDVSLFLYLAAKPFEASDWLTLSPYDFWAFVTCACVCVCMRVHVCACACVPLLCDMCLQGVRIATLQALSLLLR